MTISAGATSNMKCSGGVCAPTAKNAVLNVSDLETLLASGNVEVTTTGSGVQAKDILVKAPFGWSSTNSLTLDAYESIAVDKPVSITGLSRLSIKTNDGGSGTLSFGSEGSVGFQNLSSQLAINGTAYTLVNTIAALVAAIAANPGGAYALAGDYDASGDGTYPSAPVATTFTGRLEGLGNVVSGLSINDTVSGDSVGFFVEIGYGGIVASLSLKKIAITAITTGAYIGGLAAFNYGTIANASVTGSVKVSTQGDNTNTSVGGLVGWNFGEITQSHAGDTVTVTGGEFNTAGGLVALNTDGAIVQSYATGKASARGHTTAGGLVGRTDSGEIVQSYSTGEATTGKTVGDIGGLVGYNTNDAKIEQAYSTGRVVAGADAPYTGGLIGLDSARQGSISSSYWDTTTSGITKLSQGAGFPKNDQGITGLTTTQLQSGLPSGFDPAIWAENPNINNGLPYLIANPPLK